MKKRNLIVLALSFSAALLVADLVVSRGRQVRADQEAIDTSLKIPLTAVNIRPGLIMTRPSVKGIEIQVSGSAERMASLQGSKLAYTLDLSGLTDGMHTIPILAQRIKLPEGISILAINPSTVTVRIDKEISKRVPVVVSLEGEAAPGFQVTGTSALPGEAQLSGPQDILNNIGHVNTNPIDIAGASESFKKEITLDLRDHVAVAFPTDPIIAQVVIGEKSITRSFRDLPVQGRNTALPYSISPPAISIDIKGPINVVNTLESRGDFMVYLDLAGLKPGVYVRRATIALPVTTSLVGVSPEIFTVTIKAQ